MTPPLDRNAPCPCGSGKRYKSCCYARDRGRADMLGLAAGAHRAVDDVLAHLLPVITSRGEHTIACRAGCNACCSQLIRVTWPEALLVAAWLLEPDQAELRARFEAALPAWREAVAEERATVEELLARHAGPPLDEPDRQRYVDATLAYHRRDAMCPFNDAQGNCGIYPVRPLPCRATYVEGTAEHCGPGDPQGPSVLKHPSLQGALQELRTLLLDSARRSPSQPAEAALPTFVAAALASLSALRLGGALRLGSDPPT